MTQRLPDTPSEVKAALETLHEHLAGVGHVLATTTFGPPSFREWRLCVIGEPGIEWERVPKTWRGYEVEQLESNPRRPD
jgi:hypothetical protein